MNLKQILDDNSITQAWLAKSLGVSTATINLIVNHGQYPKRNADTIKQKLVETLNLLGIDLNTINQALNAPSSNNQTIGDAAIQSSQEEQLMLCRDDLNTHTKQYFKLFRNIFLEEVRTDKDFFKSKDINEAREALWQAAKGNDSFIAIVGESGAGKTTIKEDFFERIEDEAVITIEPYMTESHDNDKKGKQLKASHITEAILSEIAPLERMKLSPQARTKQLHNALKESKRSGNHHLVIIDEAQSLTIPTLKSLKRLLELKIGRQPLLSIAILGQPELELKLNGNNPEVREVTSRIMIYRLNPFTRNTLVDYLQHRCKAVDRDLSEFIDESGLDAIYNRLTTKTTTRGRVMESILYPLVVGNLLTRALNVAAELGAGVVTGDLVMEV